MPIKQPPPPPAKSEREQEIERLQAQVKRADEKGLTDTCHHEMLRRLVGATTTHALAHSASEEQLTNG